MTVVLVLTPAALAASIGLDLLLVDSGEMRSVTTASLVAAAVLSTAIFPAVALRLRRMAADGGDRTAA